MIWSYDITSDAPARSFHGSMLDGGDLIFVPAHGEGAHVYAFAPTDGAVRWKYATPSGSATDVVADDGAVYVVTMDDELVCLDRTSGTLRWSFAGGTVPPEARTMGSTPALGNGRIYFGDLGGTVHALETRTGQLVWERKLGSEVTTSILVDNGSLYVGVAVDPTGSDEAGDRCGALFRIVAATGNVQSKTAVSPPPGGALVRAGDRIVTMLAPSSSESEVAGFALTTAVSWRTSAPEGYWTTGRPSVYGNRVIAGTSTGGVFAYDVHTGSTLWSHAIAPERDWEMDNVRVIGGNDEILLVGTIGGTLYAFQVDR